MFPEWLKSLALCKIISPKKTVISWTFLVSKKAVYHRLSYKWDLDMLEERCLKPHTILVWRTVYRNAESARLKRGWATSNNHCAIGRCTEIEKNPDNFLYSNAVLPAYANFFFFLYKGYIRILIYINLICHI